MKANFSSLLGLSALVYLPSITQSQRQSPFSFGQNPQTSGSTLIRQTNEESLAFSLNSSFRSSNARSLASSGASQGTQKQEIGIFCQFSSECLSNCCYSQQCLDYNTCSLMSQINQFEEYNYCTLDSQCSSGNCCQDQMCVPEIQCILWIYVPLFISVVLAFIVTCIAMKLIQRCLRKQRRKIKLDIKRKKRRANRKKRKQEKQRLLGEHNEEDSEPENDEEEDEAQRGQQQPQGQSFFGKLRKAFAPGVQSSQQPYQAPSAQYLAMQQKQQILMAQQAKLMELKQKYPQQFQKLMEQMKQKQQEMQAKARQDQPEEERKAGSDDLDDFLGPNPKPNPSQNQEKPNDKPEKKPLSVDTNFKVNQQMLPVQQTQSDPISQNEQRSKTPESQKAGQEEIKSNPSASLNPPQPKKGGLSGFLSQSPTGAVADQKVSVLAGMRDKHMRDNFNKYEAVEGPLPHEVKKR